MKTVQPAGVRFPHTPRHPAREPNLGTGNLPLMEHMKRLRVNWCQTVPLRDDDEVPDQDLRKVKLGEKIAPHSLFKLQLWFR